MQNAEEHTHGFVAPDLGMGAHRNSIVLAAMLGREVYPIEKRIAFQQFGVPDRLRVMADADEQRLDDAHRSSRSTSTRDPDLLHGWVTHPRSVFWGMQDASVDDVARRVRRDRRDPHHEAFLGRADGRAAVPRGALRPGAQPAGRAAELAEGDVGMHVLVAPTDPPSHGFTRAVMRAVMRGLLRRPAVRRVVVEPDARNDAIAALNAAVGFVVAPPRRAARQDRRPVRRHPRVLRRLRPRERAHSMTLTTENPPHQRTADGRDVAHLTPDNLARAHRALVAKAIAEFTHERIIRPARDGDGLCLETPDGRGRYRFRARELALEHWLIDRSTSRARARRRARARSMPRSSSSSSPTCSASRPRCCRRTSRRWPARWPPRPGSSQHHRATPEDLVDASYQEVEAAMTEGHPGFVANNGRSASGSTTTSATRRRPGAGPAGVARLPPDSSQLSLRRGPRPRRSSTRGELGEDVSRTVRRAAARAGTGPGGLPLAAGAPVAVDQQGSRSPSRPTWLAATWCSSARGRRPTARSSRSAPSSTLAARPALREDRPVDAEHGLPARALAGLHGGTPAINDWVAEVVTADHTLRRVRLHGAARAGRHRLHRRRLPPADAHVAVPARCSRRCGARARCPGSRRGAAGHDGVAAAPRPRRRRSSPSWSALRPGAARSGSRPTCAPTSGRSCTACCATTWRSCRTART